MLKFALRCACSLNASVTIKSQRSERTQLLYLLQVTPYQEDEVVLICSSKHPLRQSKHVSTKQLKELKYVSLFQSSTVQAIKATLTQHHIQWQALQVVLVSTKCHSHAVCRSPTKHCVVCDGSLLTRALMYIMPRSMGLCL